MTVSWLALVAGFAAAGVGGELFIRGAVRLAQIARLTTAVIGVTVAAFATSSPELSVSVNSALAGTPEIALGDALGSNVVNVALILALAALFSPIPSQSQGFRRDFAVALSTAPVIALLAWDGQLSRLDGLLMLILFFGWLALVVIEAHRHRHSIENAATPSGSTGNAIAIGFAGFALLVLAGRLVVFGAQGIGQVLGMDPFIVGATMVSIGTSIPELAATLVAQVRGHTDIGLGTILGSNIFNAFFIVAVAAIIRPIPVAWPAVAVGLGFGALAMLLALPKRRWVTRGQGALLLVVYVAYLLILFWAGSAMPAWLLRLTGHLSAL